MGLSSQEAIKIILSFTYEQLHKWIKSRLHGDDGHFPIYEGHETNLSEFLTETFKHIKDEEFRDNFIEILNDLTDELTNYSREDVKKEAEYIYELLLLCRSIRQFKNKDNLYKIAHDGTLKGITAYEIDLHQILLSTLASYRVAGGYQFWIGQMYDESNIYYANAAFYALLGSNRLDILFKHIGVFIDRFKGELDLELGIQALINDHGRKEIFERFRGIEESLSTEQKSAVNHVFFELGYDHLYHIPPIEIGNIG